MIYVHTDDGQIVCIANAPIEEVRQAHPGLNVVEIDGYFSDDAHFIRRGKPVKMADRPGPRHIFDYSKKKWCNPTGIEELKADKWMEIKAARDREVTNGFTWNGLIFDSDATAQANIHNQSHRAKLTGDDFKIDWILKDNSIRTLDAIDMAAVCVALDEHIAAQYQKSQALRKKIADARSAAGVNTIGW